MITELSMTRLLHWLLVASLLACKFEQPEVTNFPPEVDCFLLRKMERWELEEDNSITKELMDEKMDYYYSPQLFNVPRDFCL